MSDVLLCNACQIAIESDEERAAHYKSEWHRYNVKRRCAGLTSIPQALFDSQLAALHKRKAAESSARATQQCRPCQKSFATASAYQAHLNSKKHIKKVEKGGPVQDDEEEEEEKESSASAKPAAPIAASSSASSAFPEESKSDGDDDMEDEDDEEEEGEAIPLLHCLFCSKHGFKNNSAACDHMLKAHGFFIPFVENLVDLDGLLTYLGEKIGIGHVCLWCNGKGRARYPSTRAVQQHMTAKSHCKLALEDEDDEDEIMDFYDFDLDEEEEEDAPMDGSASSSSAKSSTALVAVDKSEPRRTGGGGAASINDAGELVLADGSIVGNRQHKAVYKQHVRPSRELAVITQSYKQMALATNVKENPRIARRKREQFHVRARKREDLHTGRWANNQKHFRAQVLF